MFHHVHDKSEDDYCGAGHVKGSWFNSTSCSPKIPGEVKISLQWMMEIQYRQ